MKNPAKDLTSTAASGFASDPNTQCVTSSVVLNGRAPVRFVWHDDADGRWHFHQGGPVDRQDRLTVPLKLVTEMDVTLSEIRDLALGSYAERGEVGSPWRRRSRPLDEVD